VSSSPSVELAGLWLGHCRGLVIICVVGFELNKAPKEETGNERRLA